MAFWRSKVQVQEVSLRDQVNHLESRVRELELKTAEREVAVLKSVEKVLYQLRAREAKRAKLDGGDPAGGAEGGGAQDPAVGGVAASPSYGRAAVRGAEPTAHLATRFRRF